MTPRLLHRREAGMSLVELMVAMLIGLIGVVIITHLYVTNDQYKRSTTGIGSAQINGAVALYTMERDLRMAGYGVAHSMALNCRCAQPLCSPLRYYYDNNSSFPPAPAAAGALPPRAPVPVVIIDNPVGPDQITVLYSAANERMLPAALDPGGAMSPPYDYKVDSKEGFRVGNLVMVSDGAGTCALRQITAIQPADSILQHGTTGHFNPAGSVHPPMPGGSAVFDLGNPEQMVWRTYFVGANKLRSEDVLGSLGGAPSQALVDDIVDLQAEYGWDGSLAPDPSIVDNWTAAPPVDPADPTKILWERILAVRVGVLARSQNFEKPSTAGGPCEATTAAPAWAGGAFTVPGGLPSCYKHRVFETVVPLRNMIWRSS
jgi:type IV pilus assembly protein PilW